MKRRPRTPGQRRRLFLSGAPRARLPRRSWPAREPSRWDPFEVEWERLVALQSDIDLLAYDLEVEAGPDADDDDDPLACVWCGAPVPDGFATAHRAGSIEAHGVEFPMSAYWGPLRFDESDPDGWLVGLLLGGDWRWLLLLEPLTAGARHDASGPTCSARCTESFMSALRRDTAERRPH